MKIFRRIMIGFLSVIDIFLIIFLIFINQDYKALGVSSYLTTNKTVEVVNIEKDIYFKPKQNDKHIGLIFYSGALVEKEAYAPMMNELANDGYTVVLADMPYKLAFFAINKAYQIASDNKGISWYIGGHSLGGAMASECYYKHNDLLKGLVLLASYSTRDLTGFENGYVLSVFGSNDKVLSKDKYDSNFHNIKSKVYEFKIDGANHAGFGSYGEQKGDGINTISAQKQWSLTRDYISSFMSHTLDK